MEEGMISTNTDVLIVFCRPVPGSGSGHHCDNSTFMIEAAISVISHWTLQRSNTFLLSSVLLQLTAVLILQINFSHLFWFHLRVLSAQHAQETQER